MADETARGYGQPGKAGSSRSAAPASSSNGSGQRSVSELRDDIVGLQAQLATTVDAITDRVSPKNVTDRAKATARAQVVDPVRGTLRGPRLAAVGGVVLLYVVLKAVAARRRRSAARASAGPSSRRSR